MKKNKGVLILAAVFVLLMGGAFVLYNKLSKTVEHSVLDTQAVTEAESPAAEPESSGAEPVAEPESSGAAEAEKSPAEAAEPPAEESPAEAQMAVPDFTVTDGDGNPVSLSDFIGKPIIVNFWASWCGPCKMEMPDFEKAYSQYGEEIHFVIVNLTDGSRETVETAKRFIEEQGYTFPVYFDTDSSAAIAYGVSSIPASYFIDAAGNPIAQARGALDAETLQKGIDMILEGS